MITIDGSTGEGGGQVLRTALALSIITGKAFEIINIRARRKKPGLMAQHLKCVEAAAKISRARVAGAHIGSAYLQFEPLELTPGDYQFDIGTAGATSLVLQTIFLPLSLATAKSTIIITGGTHVPWSPPVHYLTSQWLPFMKQIGLNLSLHMILAGFYPQGGGKISADIYPTINLAPINLLERGALVAITGISAVANLDQSIAIRQERQVKTRLQRAGYQCAMKLENMPSKWKNTMVLLAAEYENGRGCFSALGAIGKRAEKVADEAVDELLAYTSSSGCVDHYLADQLLLPLSIVNSKSQFSTSRVSQHLLTNIDIIHHFLDTKIQVKGQLNEEGEIEITNGK